MIQHVSSIESKLNALGLGDLNQLAGAEIESEAAAAGQPSLTKVPVFSRRRILNRDSTFGILDCLVGACGSGSLSGRHIRALRIRHDFVRTRREEDRQRTGHLRVALVFGEWSNDLYESARRTNRRTYGVEIGIPSNN